MRQPSTGPPHWPQEFAYRGLVAALMPPSPTLMQCAIRLASVKFVAEMPENAAPFGKPV
jgi:hypothetical protein